jgi:hypothetical protein
VTAPVRIALAAAAAWAALAAGAARAAEVAPAPAGTVTFLAGEASRFHPREPQKGVGEQGLAVGSVVYEHDRLETRRRTRLEVRLRDGSALRLGPRSSVLLDEARFGQAPDDRKVSARLLVGNVWASVAKAVGGDARFEVTTANAVAGVRGTTFRVDASRDRSCVVKVYAGTVAVASGPIPRPGHGAPGADADGDASAAKPLAATGKGARTPVAGPQQVSRAQWERIVTGMMQVRVSADGAATEPERFALAQGAADEFERWNRSRDAGE